MGKKTTARRLASEILGVPEEKLDINPDFYHVARQEDEKTGKLKKDIGIDQARQAKEWLSRMSWFGNYRIVIIDEAECLSEKASNALLKILEEAGGKTVFFLLTSDDNSLLPTIRSRCQTFYFPLVSEDEIFRGMISLGFEEEKAKKAARLSWGRPGRAISMLENEDLMRENEDEARRWEKLSGQPFYKQSEIVGDLFGDKKDGVRTRDKLQKALDVWVMFWRDKMLEKASGRESGKFSMLEICKIIDRLRAAGKLLEQNVNSQLIVEHLLLNI